MEYRIIYKAGRKHAIQKIQNPYYITSFQGQTVSHFPLTVNQDTWEKPTGEKLEYPNMDKVPNHLDDQDSIYSIIDEIHLTQGTDATGKIVNPHITVVFKDKSKFAYYFEIPSLTDIIQITINDDTPQNTPQRHKLSHWFLNNLNGPEQLAKVWLINMLINYLDSFDLLEDSVRLHYFPYKQPVFYRQRILDFIPDFPYMRPEDWPSPTQGFLPPIWFPDCSKAPVSQFNYMAYRSNPFKPRFSPLSRARGKSRGKSRGKPSRRKSLRGKQSRGKPSRRKH